MSQNTGEFNRYDRIFLFASGKNTLCDSPWTLELKRLIGDDKTLFYPFDLEQPFEDQNLLAQYRKVIESIGCHEKLIIGGKSQGGRIASLLADEYGVRASFCIGYPFYTPEITDDRRITPLMHLKTPMLIVQGEFDQYGEKEVVETYQLAAGVRFVWLEGEAHQLVGCEERIAQQLKSII